MAAKEPLEIPDGMRRVCRRFERWRNGHKAGLPDDRRIPLSGLRARFRPAPDAHKPHLSPRWAERRALALAPKTPSSAGLVGHFS